MMDTEQLKMIIDMFGQATDTAVWVAVLWIVSGKVYGLTILSILVWLALKVANMLVTMNKTVEYFKRVRDRYGIGVRGCLSESEADQVIKKIEEALDKV